MKKFFSILFVAVFSILVVIYALPVFANKSQEITYQEDFEYGETDIAAFANCGEAEIVKEKDGNHVLHFTGNDVLYSLACFGPYAADFDFSFRMRQTILAGEFSWSKVLFHSGWGEHSTYLINFYNYRITATFGDEATKVSKNLGENPEVKFEDGIWHTVQIFARKSEYTVFVDGQKALNFVLENNPEGCFGFCGWQTEFDVDDISITEYVDNTAPSVSELVEGEEEESERTIMETQRNTRTMKDAFVSISDSIKNSSSTKKVIAIVAFSVAAVAVVMLLVLLVIDLYRRKHKS